MMGRMIEQNSVPPCSIEPMMGRIIENDSVCPGNHFNLPGHTLSNMKVTVLEKCKEKIGRSENHNSSTAV